MPPAVLPGIVAGLQWDLQIMAGLLGNRGGEGRPIGGAGEGRGTMMF